MLATYRKALLAQCFKEHNPLTRAYVATSKSFNGLFGAEGRVLPTKRDEEEEEWVFVDGGEQRKHGVKEGMEHAPLPASRYGSNGSALMPWKPYENLFRYTNLNLNKNHREYLRLPLAKQWPKWEKILRYLDEELWTWYGKEESKLEHRHGRNLMKSRLRDKMFTMKREIVQYAQANLKGLEETGSYLMRTDQIFLEFAKAMKLDWDDAQQSTVKKGLSAAACLKSPSVGKGEESKVDAAHSEPKTSGLLARKTSGEEDVNSVAAVQKMLAELKVKDASANVKAAQDGPAYPKLHGSERLAMYKDEKESNDPIHDPIHSVSSPCQIPGSESPMSLSTDHPCSPFNTAVRQEREKGGMAIVEGSKAFNNTSLNFVMKPNDDFGEQLGKENEGDGFASWKRVEIVEEKKEEWEDDE